jgi:hypothetical protein
MESCLVYAADGRERLEAVPVISLTQCSESVVRAELS